MPLKHPLAASFASPSRLSRSTNAYQSRSTSDSQLRLGSPIELDPDTWTPPSCEMGKRSSSSSIASNTTDENHTDWEQDFLAEEVTPKQHHTSVLPQTPTRAFPKRSFKRICKSENAIRTLQLSASAPFPFASHDLEKTASAVGRDIVQEVIDEKRTSIDFTERGLSRVPDNIAALNKLKLFKNGAREQLSVWLSRNFITTLPPSLFTLTNVVALSLHTNVLTSLSPLIGQMQCLKILHLGQNRLTFLPAEINLLELERLVVDDNSFLPPPSIPNSLTGPIQRASRAASLQELSLRILLQQSKTTGLRPIQTIDWEHVGLPQNITSTLQSCLEAPAAYRCISPTCTAKGQLVPTFAEERIVWTNQVAGVELDTLVPLKYRGCSAGCLDYLDS